MSFTFGSRIARTAGIATLALFLCAASAGATSISFTSLSTDDNNVMGNSLTLYSSGGLTVTGTAWVFNTSPNPDVFQTAGLDIYHNYGLGVCNSSEGQNCSSPEHQVDNSSSSKTEFVLFQFSQAVDPTSIFIRNYSGGDDGGDDLDVSYWVGATSPASLTGAQLSASPNYALAGMGNMLFSDYNGNSASRSVSLTSGYVTSLLVGARLGSSGNNDYFKVQSLTFDTQSNLTLTSTDVAPVPEPGSMVLLGTGLLGVAARIRRRIKK